MTLQAHDRYPAARRMDLVEVMHGTPVPDPYRWLEDAESTETKAWAEAQNAVTESFLASVPQRATIHERLTRLWNFERFGTPIKRGGHYIFGRNDGLQNQDVLLVTDALDAPPRVLLDPNTLSADGTVALNGISPSPDGRYLAYAVSDGGSDWMTWRIRNIASGTDLTDEVKWVKFSGASWMKDGSGFFYSRFHAPRTGEALQEANHFHQVWFHQVGTPQAADTLIYRRDDEPEWNFDAEVTDDGHYLVIRATKGTLRKVNLYFRDLATNGPIQELFGGFQAGYDFLGNDGSTFWLSTDDQAARGRIITIDANHPTAGTREIVPQAPATLTSALFAGGRLVASYLADAHAVLRVFELDGRAVGTIPLPGLGSVDALRGHPSDDEIFYSYSSFTTPGAIYRYDVKTGHNSVFRQPALAFDPADFETSQVFCTSQDGTKVPMFLTHRKGVEPDGHRPVLLYGYGGFNIPMTPAFSVTAIVWMEMGGVYAVPNLRGGGEYGEEWHLAGTRLKKQNVFDDFIAAAEWLVSNHWTEPRRIATFGGSNGGLLVAACMVQRPELFGACMPAVGVLDMLRFHKFTIGWAWVSDYGSPEDVAEFGALWAYSPYHRLVPGTAYPATLITTGDHDDRVVPAHSYKFAAALQHAQRGTAPTLIRIETRAGHGAGKPTKMRIDEASDRLAFLVQVLGL